MHAIEYTHAFEAAHRLQNHNGKCKNLHGHSYKVVIRIERNYTGPDGMVLDFAEVKEGIGYWIDEQLDHNVILEKGDPLIDAVASFSKHPYVMDAPPTAEEIAKMLYCRTASWLAAGRRSCAVVFVTVQETEKCKASYGA